MSSKSEAKKDLISGGLSLLDQVVVSATNFLTIAILSHHCSTSEMGVFALTWTVANFFRTAQERIVLAPYTVYAQHPSTDRTTYLGSVLVHGFLLSAVGTLVVLAIALVFYWRSELPLSTLLCLLSISLPMLLLREQVRVICSANFRFAVAFVLDAIIGFMQLIAVIVFAGLQQLSTAWTILLIGLVCLPPCVWWFVANRRTYRFERSAALSDWRRNWNFSRWLLLARLMSMGGFLIMPWLVAWQLGDKATGAFSVCNSLIGFSLMFIVGTNNFFQPKTYREYRRSGTIGMNRAILESIGLVGVVLIGVTFVLYFWGGEILGWIYGQGYADAGPVVFVLSLFSLTMCVSIAVSNGLSALEKPHLYLWGEGAFLLATLCSAWFLMPSMGLLGAAVALVIGGVVVSIANIALLAISVRQIDHVAGQAIPRMGDPV